MGYHVVDEIYGHNGYGSGDHDDDGGSWGSGDDDDGWWGSGDHDDDGRYFDASTSARKHLNL